MRGFLDKLVLVPLALALTGCILTMDEPEREPLVGTWILLDFPDCGESKMTIERDLEGVARIYGPEMGDCIYWDYEVVAETKGNDEYEIDWDFELCWNETDDEEFDLPSSDMKLECEIDGDRLECQEGSSDLDWEKE